MNETRYFFPVIPAQAGIQNISVMDPRLRGDD